ncbi:hypothetical protein ABNK63_09040 [Rhodanobacter sp. IGA1.0]|uniref:Uncharacterized protein n=1 Tax=Rhodanobacter sp. IGA1.0 TaxID=3158582 RepID=A0AAU7QFX1_9GAMM
MRLVEVLLAIGGCVAGLVSAGYWLKASVVPIDPIWSKQGGVEPGVHSLSQDGWISGMLEAALESARLNKIAARWTAATVVLAAISALVGTFSG